MSELPPIPRPEQRPLPPPPGGQRRIVLPPHRERARRPRSVRAREWVRRNLFPSARGTLLTALAAAVLGGITYGLIEFIFFGANWEVITHNRWLLFAGGFPREEAWRLWVSIALVFSLIGLAYGTWSSLGRRDHLFVLLVGGFVIFLMAHGGAAVWSSVYFLIAVGCMYLGYLLTYQLPRATSSLRTLQVRVVGGLLILALPIVLVLLLVGGNVGIRDLDGFVLNLILAPVGIVGGILIGIPLAVGRASNLKTISWTCTAYIEIVRGAPLLGWLFVALFILDDIIGGDLIIRAMVVMAVFTGAYMAEYIRGALQALPRGQYEAGQAVGLSQWQRTRLIIMPQALRISIPPMVGQAISIWKDTTLVTVILPLRELKGNADSAISQFEFTPDRIEAYVFVAVIFWIVAFMMSRISQRVERAQGVGER
ncbi:MAG: amino acid ABC transporter permease [Chloroflexi bacterium]|nr:amino acid ABC transporter permease [Chloroflexota bacterium]MCY3696836.1 amino acid ABC transporter permease [Chloroflexota bacterium]MYB21141.1 amino acid ABC transporter permease [Chloroflexota bacterium]MYD16126.1 amino acid ABC transporter permease [Chloroflexota bacterium]MYF81036.1 amino acid ABC transporter permease [Chloroflexota bacterium]